MTEADRSSSAAHSEAAGGRGDAPSRFVGKHLTGIDPLDPAEVIHILESAEDDHTHVKAGGARQSTLDGATVVNLFFENSTRTRMSFEMAAQHLGAYVINFDVGTSSVTKGESLRDTIETIEAAGADIIVMRHSSSGAAEFVSRFARASIVNAGDGWHEHPTQALLDAYTIKRSLGQVSGKRVTIVGDVLHSRVARSNMICLRKLGAEVTVCGPSMFVPDTLETFGVKVCHDMDEAIAGVDVIYLLRIQTERQQARRFPSVGEYRRLYGLDIRRLERANAEALVMHPGPVNRGVEISDEVFGRERTVVIDQVAHGVPVRMAVLRLVRENSLRKGER